MKHTRAMSDRIIKEDRVIFRNIILQTSQNAQPAREISHNIVDVLIPIQLTITNDSKKFNSIKCYIGQWNRIVKKSFANKKHFTFVWIFNHAKNTAQLFLNFKYTVVARNKIREIVLSFHNFAFVRIKNNTARHQWKTIRDKWEKNRKDKFLILHDNQEKHALANIVATIKQNL